MLIDPARQKFWGANVKLTLGLVLYMLVNGQDVKLTLLYCSVLFKRLHCSCSETLLHERTHNLLPELISFVFLLN